MSSNFFFAGKNSVQTENIASYHIWEPETYILEWLQMAERPKYFIGDGDQFANICMWKQCLAYGLKIIIVECTCSKLLQDLQYKHRGRGKPSSWQSICAQYKELLCWKHTAVSHIQVDTTSLSSFAIVHNILIPLLKPKFPIQIASSVEFTYYDVCYENHKDLLSPTIFSFLQRYAQEQTYMKEEGLIHGTIKSKPRGIWVEDNIGCGIAYKGMGVDPLCMHPMLR